MAVRELLGPGGPLAAAMADYEVRDGQLAMAAAVERTLEEDRILLCEAGTGTGKTLAYLVPALLCGRTVVVSTATRALQEQIALKDLPFCARHLGVEADYAMVKGLGNYVCLRRLEEAQALPASERVARALPLVRRFADRTASGDVAELDELEETHPVWSETTSSSETRIGSRCRHFDACFVTRLRQKAAAARLLVVNHHLLMADLALMGDHPGRVLPPYDALVVDEAHRLEDVATSFFGARVSSHGVERLLADTGRMVVRAGLEDLEALVSRAADLARRMFSLLNLEAADASEREPLPGDSWRGPRLEAYHALDQALEVLCLDVTSRVRGQHDPEPPLHAARRVDALRQKLAAIVEPPGASIAWLERREHGIVLQSSPVDIGSALRTKLFARGLPVVLTSASLTSAGGFGFVRARLGLDQPLEAPIDELEVPPAFDHAKQSLLYTPVDLPEVDAAEFVAAAALRIAELCRLLRGGAFVLCTSTRAMRAFARSLETIGRELLVQGQAPKAALLDRFRRVGDAVLVATMSFWEGVDVPGSALELVVIDRLPFAVPTDPLVAARCRSLEEAGRSGFADYSVPHAAITLKQGFGRLLRTRRDRGVVAILDRRIQKRRYGRVLLASLPPVRVTDAIADVEALCREWHGARP
jgi:ATP-dependent DNA helicase DinG